MRRLLYNSIKDNLVEIDSKIHQNHLAIERISQQLTHMPSEANRLIAPDVNVPSFKEIQRLQYEADQENKEIDKRKDTCVIFNLKESIDDFVPRLCAELGMNESDVISSSTISSAKRPTKPVKLKLSSEALKWHVVGKISVKFRDKHIYAKPDLTSKQAAEEKILVQKLMALRAKNDGKIYKIKKSTLVCVNSSNGDCTPIVEC